MSATVDLGELPAAPLYREGAVVAEGVPMQLHSVGTDVRRAVALILHDGSHRWSVLATDWTTKGLCSQSTR